MPVYDYLCTACDHRADILHGINDPGPNFCPSCGAEGTMRKQFAAPAIHFKGSGWAKKDRGGSGGTKAAAKSAAGESRDGDSRQGEPRTGEGGAAEPRDGKSSEGRSSEGKSSESRSSEGSSAAAASDTPKPSSSD